MMKVEIMRKSLLLAAFLTALPFAAHQAAAQQAMTPGAPAEACKASKVTLDARVAGCTTVIDEKKETGRGLSVCRW